MYDLFAQLCVRGASILFVGGDDGGDIVVTPLPDVAAQALNFLIVVGGRDFVAESMGCATPLTSESPAAAGMISLLNDFLLSKGRNPLGFFDLWLYGQGVLRPQRYHLWL
ncbi:hypothetical protein EDB87DRAFT_1682333 [Lactarius vividus]|nr:hypothetical protein EDB87DRAFT_1682333 [Lactarius vividus]